MTHAYYDQIQVTLAADGRPTTICWRGITYRVSHLNKPWHLMDREWEPPKASGASGGSTGPSDRTYYRVSCGSAHVELVCEIYFEAVGGGWILERVYD